jgi:hypothetical protein
MRYKRCFILFTITAACHAASITANGSISFYCWTPIGGPTMEVISSSDPFANLNAVCPSGAGNSTRAGLAYSSSYGSLSAASSGYWFSGSGAYANAYAGFSDIITVLGPSAGFLLVSGQMQVNGSADAPPSTLHAGLSLDGPLFQESHQSHHGTLDLSPPGVSTTTRPFTYLVPFTAGNPMAFSAYLDVHTGGIYVQGIGGSLNVALTVLDSDMAPVNSSLQSQSGFTYSPVPEPRYLVVCSTMLLAGFLLMRQHRPTHYI